MITVEKETQTVVVNAVTITFQGGEADTLINFLNAGDRGTVLTPDNMERTLRDGGWANEFLEETMVFYRLMYSLLPKEVGG